MTPQQPATVMASTANRGTHLTSNSPVCRLGLHFPSADLSMRSISALRGIVAPTDSARPRHPRSMGRAARQRLGRRRGQAAMRRASRPVPGPRTPPPAARIPDQGQGQGQGQRQADVRRDTARRRRSSFGGSFDCAPRLRRSASLWMTKNGRRERRRAAMRPAGAGARRRQPPVTDDQAEVSPDSKPSKNSRAGPRISMPACHSATYTRP